MEAVEHCLKELSRYHDSFIDQETVFANVKSIPDVVPIRPIRVFDGLPIPFLEEINEWAEVSIFFRRRREEPYT